MMLNNIRFQSKLTLLLGTTILGLAIVFLVSYFSLNSQEQASSQYQSLTQIDKSLDTLALKLFKQDQSKSLLSEASYPEFANAIQNQKTLISNEFDLNRSRIDDPDSIALLTKVQQDVMIFLSGLEELLKQQQVVGFDVHSGLKAALSTTGKQVIDSISFLTLLKQEFDQVRESERNYTFEPSAQNFDLLESRFNGFLEQLINFGLDESFSPAISEYQTMILQLHQENLQLTKLQEQHTLNLEQLTQSQLTASSHMQEAVENALSTAHTRAQMATTSLIVFSVLIAAIAYLVMSLISRSVNKTLKQITQDLTLMKQGDLTISLPVNRKRNDVFDALCESINEMSSGLGAILYEVTQTAHDVNNRVAELNQSVKHISSNNHQVSGQTNALATATEEISTTISSISTTTDELSNQANLTYDSAKQGTLTIQGVLSDLSSTIETVNITSQKLDDLGQLSQDIDNVIGMINELANQTNLLALNAAIEAARAGEAGRGFSVVADEVRSLAEKTVEATSKITGIVNTIQSSTQSAIETMQGSQTSLNHIARSSEKAEHAMKDIEHHAFTGSSSSQEMATSIQEVAKTAIHMSEEMDKIAQQLASDSSNIVNIQNNTDNIHQKVVSLDTKTRTFTV